MRNTVLAVCALFALGSCSGTESEDSRSDGSGEKETDDFEKAIPPTPITGINLALDCSLVSSNQDAGTYQVGCNLLYKGAGISPADVANNYRWTIAENDNISDVSVKENEQNYHAVYTFGESSYVKIADLQKLDLEFRFKPENTEKEEVVTERIDQIIQGLANQLHFKLVMKSILVASEGEPLDFIGEIEVKVDGKWLTIRSTGTGQLVFEDGTVIESNGTANDVQLFQSIYGMLNYELTPEMLVRYANTPPYDAADPLYLAYSFGEPVSVSGIRYNGGEPFINKNLPTGFPDSIHFEVSQDGKKWTTVEGSEINVEKEFDQDILEFFFNGSDY